VVSALCARARSGGPDQGFTALPLLAADGDFCALLVVKVLLEVVIGGFA